MKKLYYEIELRIGEWSIYEDAFKEYGDLYYFSEGYIILENDCFEGFLANDIMLGEIDKNNETDELYIELLDYNIDEEFMSFSGQLESVEFPGSYILAGLSECQKFAAIKFIKSIIDPFKQKSIEEELKRVKKIHTIP